MNRIQALRQIKQLYEKDQLEDATYRFAVDVIDLCNEGASNAWNDLQQIQTVCALAQWRRVQVVRLQEKLDEEEFAERYEIGHGMTYGCIEQMLSCIDHDFMLHLIRQRQINED